MISEKIAKKLETDTELNGRANVCVHCGKVPETFYVVTGHDHTDDSIRWCICREAGQYKDEITTLRQRVAELEAERDALKQQRDKLVEAARLAVEMIEYNKHERRHIRWKLLEAIASVKEKQNAAAD